MAAKALQVIEAQIEVLEEIVPVDVRTAPLETLNGAQALGRAALSGSQQLARIIEQQLSVGDTSTESLKQQRLVGDMALGANKLLREHATSERNHDLIGRLLAAMAAEKEDPSED